MYISSGLRGLSLSSYIKNQMASENGITLSKNKMQFVVRVRPKIAVRKQLLSFFPLKDDNIVHCDLLFLDQLYILNFS